MWVPAVQYYSFWWFFSHAILRLIPLKIQKRVRRMMKDGDVQQRNEFLHSLECLFPNMSKGS